jgi:hypothetical protein
VNPDLRGESGDAKDVVANKAGRTIQTKYIARSVIGHVDQNRMFGVPGWLYTQASVGSYI